MSPGSDLSQATDEALIDHILVRYHQTHREELADLVTLAGKVEAVHAGHPGVPAGLGDALQQMWGDLEVHMKKEELILFPAMRRGAGPVLGGPIIQMRHDHDDHAVLLGRLETMTHGFEIPEGACRTWQALYVGMAKLAQDLAAHIELENTVLFPRFESP